MDYRDRLIAYSKKKYGIPPEYCVVELILPPLQEAQNNRIRTQKKLAPEHFLPATLQTLYIKFDQRLGYIQPHVEGKRKIEKPWPSSEYDEPSSEYDESSSESEMDDEDIIKEEARKKEREEKMKKIKEAFVTAMLTIFVFIEMVKLNAPLNEIYAETVFDVVKILLSNDLDPSKRKPAPNHTQRNLKKAKPNDAQCLPEVALKVNNLMNSCKTAEFYNLVIWFDIFKTQKINENFTATFSMENNVFEKLFIITQIPIETLKKKTAYDLLFWMPQFEYSLMLTSESHLKLYIKSVLEEKQKEEADLLFFRKEISSKLTPENHFKLYMKSVLEFQQKTEKEKEEKPMTEDPIFEYKPPQWDSFFSLLPSEFDEKLMIKKKYIIESDYLNVTQIKRVNKDVVNFNLVKCINVNFVMVALFLKLAEETVFEIINLTQKLSIHVTDGVVLLYKSWIKSSICRYLKFLIEDINLLSLTTPWKNIMTIIDYMKQVLYYNENFKQVANIYKPKVNLVTHQTITDRFKRFAMNWLTTSYTYLSDIEFLTYLQEATKNEGDNSKNKRSVRKFECDMQSLSDDLGYLDPSLRPEENRIDTFTYEKGAGRIMNYFALK